MTTPWKPSRDTAAELERVIKHARTVVVDCDRQLAYIDGVLAALPRPLMLPESIVYFTVEQAAAQHRRNLWGAKLEELERYAELMAAPPPPDQEAVAAPD